MKTAACSQMKTLCKTVVLLCYSCNIRPNKVLIVLSIVVKLWEKSQCD